MYNSEFQGLLCLMFMAALVRVSYELSLEKPGSRVEHEIHMPKVTSDVASSDPIAASNLEFPTLSPQRREWARKAVEGYIRGQERKWRRWDEKIFKESA